MMQDNKDKREQEASLPEEETLIFRRVPDRRPSEDERKMTLESMQNTAQIQGGAVIRPLKSGQNSHPASSVQSNPQSSQKRAMSPLQNAANRHAQEQMTRQASSARNPQPRQTQPQSAHPTTMQNPQPRQAQGQTARPTTAQNPQPRQAQGQTARPTTAQNPQPRQAQGQTARPTTAQNPQPRQAQGQTAHPTTMQNPQPRQAQGQTARPTTAQNPPPRQAQGQTTRANTPATSVQSPSTASQAQSSRINSTPQRMTAPQTQTSRTMQRNESQSVQRTLPMPDLTNSADHPDFEIDDATYLRGSKRKKREKKYSYAADSATSAIMSLVKAVIYIVAIIAISVALSMFVINTANDVFKFVGEEKIITVEIPEYATIEDIGDILHEADIIKYPWAFNLWSNMKENSEEPPTFIAGTYEISTMLNYDYLRAAFKKSTTRSEVRITIPEGYTVDEIITLFVEEHKIGTREGFVEAINEHEFNYRFLEGLTVSEDRTYRLEGYLFPDTYYFYSDSTEVAVITKLLENFKTKFIDEYYDRCIDLGMSIDEVITLASMVEKEARYADELGNISSVFHNRLQYSSTFPYLQSDATIMYAIHHDTGARLDTMTGEDTDYDSPYNTYTHKGLPPGPIANPGLNAIVYALYPSDTDYFFFVANSSGRSLFAKTDAEHAQNILIARGN